MLSTRINKTSTPAAVKAAGARASHGHQRRAAASEAWRTAATALLATGCIACACAPVHALQNGVGKSPPMARSPPQPAYARATAASPSTAPPTLTSPGALTAASLTATASTAFRRRAGSSMPSYARLLRFTQGYSTWNDVGVHVSELIFKSRCDALVSTGLAALGAPLPPVPPPGAPAARPTPGARAARPTTSFSIEC